MTRIAVGGRSPSGLKWPNYVNGRLLTAQDLTTDDDAVRRRDRWLGLAVGPGVAEGLEVTGTPSSSTLHVPPGTGVSFGGTAVHLDVPATLDLTVVSSSAPVDDAVFGDCVAPTTSTAAPVAGPYVLVLRRGPGSYEEKVPVAGGPTATLPTPCTARWQVEDVEFAAIRLDGFDDVDDVDDVNRRNRLAHWCFGSANLEDLAMSGFSEPVPYSGLAALADLDDCDVPLAVFDWSGSVLTFVDRWSARRRPQRPSAATTGLVAGLSTVVDDTRTAEGEARFLQFQEQLAGLLSTTTGPSTRALDTFPLLPPAGIVPMNPLEAAANLAPSGDFSVSVTPEPAGVARAERARVVGVADVAEGESFAVTAQPSGLLEDLLGGTGAFVNIGGVSTGSTLGAVSQQMAAMQAQITALQAKVSDLESQLGDGGPDPSAQAKAYGQKLTAAVVTALADTPGALNGVDPWTFFDDVSVRFGLVDHETVDFTIRRSWYDEPIDLSRDPLVNVLFVVDSDGTFAPYVLFTKKLRGVRWLWTNNDKNR